MGGPNLNMLSPFTIEIWKVLASVTKEEIEECKRRALLANSHVKWVLTKFLGMNTYSIDKYLC